MLEVYTSCIRDLHRLSSTMAIDTLVPNDTQSGQTGSCPPVPKPSLVSSANALSASFRRTPRPRFSNSHEEDQERSSESPEYSSAQADGLKLTNGYTKEENDSMSVSRVLRSPEKTVECKIVSLNFHLFICSLHPSATALHLGG